MNGGSVPCRDIISGKDFKLWNSKFAILCVLGLALGRMLRTRIELDGDAGIGMLNGSIA